MEKKTFTRFLCLFSVFCSIYYFGFGFSESDRAAADALEVQLTYEQTLALFGTQLNATYYNDHTHTTVAKTFNYIGTTEQYKPSDWSGAVHYYSTPPTNSNQPFPFDALTGGLVYLCSDFAPSNDFVNYNGIDHANIYLNPVFSVPCSRYRQQILWSAPSGNSNVYYSEHSYINVNDSSGFTTFYPFWGGNAHYYATALTSILQNSPITENVAEVYRWKFNGIPIDFSPNTAVSRLDCTLNNGWAYNISGLRYGSTDYLSNGGVFIIVGLPSITGYEPAETTTTARTTRDPSGAGVGTAASYVTPEPVNLSSLESGVQAIVGEQIDMNANLDWIGTNIFTMTNNTAYICDMLDKIYARMVAEGQIAVNLVPADSLHTMPTDVQSQIHNAIQGFTTSQIPDAGNGYTFYNSLYSSFTSNSLSFFGIFGGFSLAFSVIVWFVFRGRH